MKIFLDQDGVLSDFEKHIFNTFPQMHGHAETLDRLPKNYRADVPKIKNWWETMPKMKGADELWNYVKKFHPTILSAYAHGWDEANSKKGKYYWLQHFYGIPKSQINLVKREDKKLYAIDKETKKPNLLIDDYMKNIGEWRSADGIAIHHVGTKSTIFQLKELGFT